jgi:hypothetical protein
MLLRRVAFPDFCEPCLPSQADKPPAGLGGGTKSNTTASEIVVEALTRLRSWSCIIDGALDAIDQSHRAI